MFGIILTGVCVVKLGYKVALSLTGYADLKLQGDWKRLWNLTLPSKGKHLLWRVGRDCLPTRCRLQA